MMVSAAAKKGSMLFWQKAAREGYSDSAADIVNCALRSGICALKPPVRGLMRASEAKTALRVPRIEWF
jgi:hypothetical protein